MKKFKFYCPTKIVFGEGSVVQLRNLITGKYKRILLHYGGGSIKKSGLYHEIIGILKELECEVYELSGVEPNPKLSLVYEGVKLAKEKDIELILAVGGGSVIDSAKAIGIGARYNGDVWDFYTGKSQVKETIPVGVVLTLPATGSEASMGSVITKEDGPDKLAVNDDIIRPEFAIMDPLLTLTLPDKQTFAGVTDILSHIFERYFTHTSNVDLTDHLCEATMKTVIKNAYILKKDPKDIAARAEIMLSGTIAHNGILGMGREDDWSSHSIAHELSAFYGTTHGRSLGIIFPAWMKYVYKENINRFVQFATNVFEVSVVNKTLEEVALEGINSLITFLKDIGVPTSLSEEGLPTDNFDLMAEKAVNDGSLGEFKKFTKEDVVKIYDLAK
ncbi:iron-containing alcohol dehydrogenase [Tissierella sp. Yu-01]|uniref:iron-containing alcohol dehydrogenase n=1 Tax=Tissierella sp. Yu-01 TaxID=3035694 RepID=UPI00240D6F46|nr:iron-containing alcohol dehydrogenase [Tissierella sp. Yu-01]WFA08343.1 iron-containing alcohol dehydrogenase [Tissierella sp. Yu-01]